MGMANVAWPRPSRELVKAGEVEMQRRLGAVVRERDSTLSRAQEMSDKLLDVEKERDSLQVTYYCVCVCSLAEGGKLDSKSPSV